MFLQRIKLLRDNRRAHIFEKILLALPPVIKGTGMALKMSVRGAKHFLTLTGSVGQRELLLTGFKGTLCHGEGLS